MFKKDRAMAQPTQHSSQQNNFCGVIGLLVVTGLWSALVGSFFGFVALAGLIGILCTRAQWARIVTLVVTAYVGLVSLLVWLFAHGQASLAGFISALIAAVIFWLLLRPGMNQYFSSAPPLSQVLPVAPRPGALPHLQQPHMAAASGPTHWRAVPLPTAAGNTHEQWARLQQQLRAEQIKEEREAAAVEQYNTKETRRPFPWLTMIVTVMVFAYAASVGGDFGRASMLLVIPGFIAAMLCWIHPRGFLLAVLILSGGLILEPDWKIVAPGIHVLLQHHGPLLFAGIALLVYVVALCSSGFAGDCESIA